MTGMPHVADIGDPWPELVASDPTRRGSALSSTALSPTPPDTLVVAEAGEVLYRLR